MHLMSKYPPIPSIVSLQVNTPVLSLDDRFIFMPWQVNQKPVRLLTFDANTYEKLSNITVGKPDFDFGTSLVFIDSPEPDNPACAHVFVINSIPHGVGDGNGQAEIQAYRLTSNGIDGDGIWPARKTIAKFTGYSPPGTSGYINSEGQLTLFFNQPVKYDNKPADNTRNNANYIGYSIKRG